MASVSQHLSTPFSQIPKLPSHPPLTRFLLSTIKPSMTPSRNKTKSAGTTFSADTNPSRGSVLHLFARCKRTNPITSEETTAYPHPSLSFTSIPDPFGWDEMMHFTPSRTPQTLKFILLNPKKSGTTSRIPFSSLPTTDTMSPNVWTLFFEAAPLYVDVGSDGSDKHAPT